MPRVPPVALALLVGACAAPRSLPVAPSQHERWAAATSPTTLAAASEPAHACERAKADLKRAIEAEPLVQAMVLDDPLDAQCRGDATSAWARGWAARGRGDVEAAAHEFMAELRGDDPVAWTGAALLELLPQLSRATRREIWKLGRSTKTPYAGGWRGVSRDRLASLRCGGRGFRWGQIGCGRTYCAYSVVCAGGGRRTLVFASRALAL